MFEFLADLWKFSKKSKKYWFMPIVITLMLVGLLLLFTEGSAISPFIYTLF